MWFTCQFLLKFSLFVFFSENIRKLRSEIIYSKFYYKRRIFVLLRFNSGVRNLLTNAELQVTSYAIKVDKLFLEQANLRYPFLLFVLVLMYNHRTSHHGFVVLAEATKLEHHFKNGGRILNTLLKFVLLYVLLVPHMRLNVFFSWISSGM
jgi:hypothetical protein